MATLSDSAPPGWGIEARSSQRSSTSDGSPSRSAPSTSTTSPLESSSGSGIPPSGTQRDPLTRRVVERAQRYAEERAHRRAHRLRSRRIGAALRQRDARAEGVRRAQQRADVAGVADAPERKRHRPRTAREILPPEDGDDARRMRERRHLREQLGATSSPATSTSAGSSPAARPASSRSSPSTANSPSLSRQRRSWSLRTSLSRSLSREVIRPAGSAARPSPARRSRRTRPGR